MTLSKKDQRRVAKIRSEVAEANKSRVPAPVVPHLATALQDPSPIWGIRPVELQQLQSRLMTLPAELRNAIYASTVSFEPIAVISPKNSQDTRNYRNVMLASRKVRREIQPIFFEDKTLCITDDALTLKYIQSLRMAMAHSATKIRVARIERQFDVNGTQQYVSFDIRRTESQLQLVPRLSQNYVQAGNSCEHTDAPEPVSDPQPGLVQEHGGEQRSTDDADSADEWENDHERWKGRYLALPRAATEDANGYTSHADVWHAADKLEICECKIRKCGRKSGNDVMEFIEQFAAALSNPGDLALPDSNDMAPSEKHDKKDMTRAYFWCCESCKTSRSARTTDAKFLEHYLAFAQQKAYWSWVSRHRPHCGLCSRETAASEKKQADGCRVRPTLTGSFGHEREERRAEVWASYRKYWTERDRRMSLPAMANLIVRSYQHYGRS